MLRHIFFVCQAYVGTGVMVMKWFSDLIVNFVVRMIIGIALIYFLNQFLMSEGIDLSVGINPITAVTSGSLGVPGVCMLYGIVFFQGL